MKNYLKKKLNKKGFTLIELIVVIAILAILALILVPSISNYVAEANISKDKANVRAVYSEMAADLAMKGEKSKVVVDGSPVTRQGLTVTFGVDATNSFFTSFKAKAESGTYSIDVASGEITTTTP